MAASAATPARRSAARYNATMRWPKTVTSVAPAVLRPGSETTTGSRNIWFIVSTSSQARL